MMCIQVVNQQMVIIHCFQRLSRTDYFTQGAKIVQVHIMRVKPVTSDEMAEMDRREKLEQQHSYYQNQAKKNQRIADYSLDDENYRTYQYRANQSQKKADEIGKKVDETVANSGENGIIKLGSDSMGLSIEIDKFTSCLVDRITGEIIDTNYSIVKKSELKSLKKKGWNFNWLAEDLSDATIYKLTLKNDDEIQGLIAVNDYPKDKALYINLAESAPSNIGLNKKYEGVGGHLFAIAAQVSLLKGYGGFLFLDAKNTELVEYYSQKFGAILLGMPHPYRMFIDEENAQKLLKIYTLEGV